MGGSTNGGPGLVVLVVGSAGSAGRGWLVEVVVEVGDTTADAANSSA